MGTLPQAPWLNQRGWNCGKHQKRQRVHPQPPQSHSVHSRHSPESQGPQKGSRADGVNTDQDSFGSRPLRDTSPNSKAPIRVQPCSPHCKHSHLSSWWPEEASHTVLEILKGHKVTGAFPSNTQLQQSLTHSGAWGCWWAEVLCCSLAQCCPCSFREARLKQLPPWEGAP